MKKPAQDLHPIQVVVRRSGVSADLLRAWEKRYQAVTPQRTAGGHRLYSDDDIERLRLIQLAMEGGRRVGDVASLATAEIQRLVGEDRLERAATSTSGSKTGTAEDAAWLGDAIAAVRRADQWELRAILSRALGTLSPQRFTSEIAAPFMHRLGELWEQGELTPGHEHAASEVMRRLLHELIGLLSPLAGAPVLVVATPSGQRHELGALVVAATAAAEGWRVTYLGSDLPAADIARVAADVDARGVAVSITTAGDTIADEVAALGAALGDLPLFVGGRAAAAVTGGATHLPDLDALRAALRTLVRR